MEITDDDKILYITDFIQFSRPLAVEFNGTRESSNPVFFFFFLRYHSIDRRLNSWMSVNRDD